MEASFIIRPGSIRSLSFMLNKFNHKNRKSSLNNKISQNSKKDKNKNHVKLAQYRMMQNLKY